VTPARALPVSYSPPSEVDAQIAHLRELRAAGQTGQQLARLRELVDRALLVERIERWDDACLADTGARVAAEMGRLCAGEAVTVGDPAGRVAVRLDELEAVARRAVAGDHAMFHAARNENLQAELATWRERAQALLRTVGGRRKRCQACATELQMVRTSLGREAPFTVEGVLNHFVDCPEAKRFRATRDELKGGG
jgi:hypothetical protein